MNSQSLSENAEKKIPEYVNLVVKELEKNGTKVNPNTLKDALLKSQQLLGCDQCANGMRW